MDIQEFLNRSVLVKNELRLRHSSIPDKQYHLLLKVFVIQDVWMLGSRREVLAWLTEINSKLLVFVIHY